MDPPSTENPDTPKKETEIERIIFGLSASLFWSVLWPVLWGVTFAVVATILLIISVPHSWITAGLLVGITSLLISYDIKSYRLPNKLVFLLLCIGLIDSYIYQEKMEMLIGDFNSFLITESVIVKALFSLGIFITFSVIISLYSHLRGKTMMGMGDIKLIAVSVFWIPVQFFPIFLLVASLLGLAFSLFTSLLKAKSWREMQNVRIPFGPALIISLFSLYIYFINTPEFNILLRYAL